MAAIAVVGTVCSGHGGFPSRPAAAGESLLTINGIPVLVQGSPYPVHSDGNSSHAGSAVSTRPWFTVNGKAVVCVGDPVDCGSTVAAGDNLVNVG
jgi:uncharacterized Zn-binding protein involved in type VI secretion